MIKVYHNYCALDKINEYQIIADKPFTETELWLWYYLGTLNVEKRFTITPVHHDYYCATSDEELPQLIFEEEVYDAERFAEKIYKVIAGYDKKMKHKRLQEKLKEKVKGDDKE